MMCFRHNDGGAAPSGCLLGRRGPSGSPWPLALWSWRPLVPPHFLPTSFLWGRVLLGGGRLWGWSRLGWAEPAGHPLPHACCGSPGRGLRLGHTLRGEGQVVTGNGLQRGGVPFRDWRD